MVNNCRFGLRCNNAACTLAHPSPASQTKNKPASNKKHTSHQRSATQSAASRRWPRHTYRATSASQSAASRPCTSRHTSTATSASQSAASRPRTSRHTSTATSASTPIVTKSLPIDLHIMIDRSTSMKGASIRECQKAVTKIASSLRPNDYLSVSTFNHQVPETCIQGKMGNINQLIKGRVQSLKASGGTALWDAIGTTLGHAASRKMHYNHTQATQQRRETRRCKIIVLTDGQDMDSETWTHTKVCQAVAKPGFPMQFILIGVGLSASTAYDLQCVCKPPAATYRHIDDAAGIAEVFHWVQKDIVKEVKKVTMVPKVEKVKVVKRGPKQYGR